MTRMYRVRFTEWQAFAMDISAGSPAHAIELTRLIRDNRGTIDFEEFDGGTDAWEAELLDDAHLPAAEVQWRAPGVRPARRRAGKRKHAPVGDVRAAALANAKRAAR